MKKKLKELNSVRSLYIILIIGVLLGQTSCRILFYSPASMPDYDNSEGIIKDYAAGDRFETIKPMFLKHLPGYIFLPKELYLSEPGKAAPGLEQYADNPEHFDSVVKLVPAGTQFSIAAIKMTYDRSTVTYIQMDGISAWVGVYLREFTDVGDHAWFRYNREYFKKLSP